MQNEITKTPTARSIFLKATILSIFFAFVLLLISAIFVAIMLYFKLNNFAKAAGTTLPELKLTIQNGLETPVSHSDYKKNILILGLDSLETRPGSPALTDTMMLLSVNLKTGQVSTIALPRDLWSQEYKTRINALYFYGKDRNPDRPELFAKETIQDLTNVEIHNTIILSMDSVAKLIDILGGIKVDVKQGFTDTQFPVPDVDVTQVTDPEKLYQTVVFEKGLQFMNGERVLQYIRSRKSSDDQGDDIARSSRQQIVINALIQRLKNLDPIKNTDVIASLYKYYTANFSNYFSVEEAIATAKMIYPSRENISFSSGSLSIYPDNQLGVITNPPTWKYNGEWVYEIRDIDGFQKEISEGLNL